VRKSKKVKGKSKKVKGKSVEGSGFSHAQRVASYELNERSKKVLL